jgi:hypothetical protein
VGSFLLVGLEAVIRVLTLALRMSLGVAAMLFNNPSVLLNF